MEQHKEMTETLISLYDIRNFLYLRRLLDEPKDNEGTEEKIGELVDDLIDQHQTKQIKKWKLTN